jgi:hypothetical protein
MKIGVLASYPDTRRDICDLLNLLSQEHDLVLYARDFEAKKFNLLLTATIIIPVTPFAGFTRFLQILWQFVYLVLGQIPVSRYNYYMTEHIKLLNSGYKKGPKFIQSTLLSISKITPKIISYDQYLNVLSWFKTTIEIQPDIDVFLCFTEISNDGVFSKILRQNKPVWTYVYSWDHPCKMKTFSKRTNYLVWNEGLKNDLIHLQNINADQIWVWGVTQFTYIEQFLHCKPSESENLSYPFSYIYLGCATGYDQLAKQEVKYCVQIAKQLNEILPDWKLVLRPYPFQNNQKIYQSLLASPNVVLDKNISINDKLSAIQHARAFFHFGTTMGYEAGYFDTPSFLIDLVNKTTDKLLYGFIHQYQNDKYLNTGPDSLVIKDWAALVEIATNLSHQKTYLYSNTKTRASTPLHTLPNLAEKLTKLISSNNNYKITA